MDTSTAVSSIDQRAVKNPFTNNRVPSLSCSFYDSIDDRRPPPPSPPPLPLFLLLPLLLLLENTDRPRVEAMIVAKIRVTDSRREERCVVTGKVERKLPSRGTEVSWRVYRRGERKKKVVYVGRKREGMIACPSVR